MWPVATQLLHGYLDIWIFGFEDIWVGDGVTTRLPAHYEILNFDFPFSFQLHSEGLHLGR